MSALQSAPSRFRTAIAYLWYGMAQSICYWGLRTLDPDLFRLGIGCYNRAIDSWPGFAHAYYWRGRIRGRELHEHTQALADLNQAIALDPAWPDAFLQRGLIQRFHGDPQAALADLRTYLSLGGEPYWRFEAERQIQMLQAELAERQPVEHSA